MERVLQRKVNLRIICIFTLQKTLSAALSVERVSHVKKALRITLNHAGIKPFTCSQCGKSFTKKMQLKDHLHIHSSENPFSCSQCGKSFTCKTNLKNHMLIHAGIKPFTCSQCGKSFTKKMQLKDHLHIHSSENPFHTQSKP